MSAPYRCGDPKKLFCAGGLVAIGDIAGNGVSDVAGHGGRHSRDGRRSRGLRSRGLRSRGLRSRRLRSRGLGRDQGGACAPSG